MKKIKKININRSRSKFQIKKKRKLILKKRKKKGYLFSKKRLNKIVIIKPPIIAPKVFNLINNPVETIFFFQKLRVESNYTKIYGKLSIRISLLDVIDIDFASISIFKSIMEEAKYYGILFSGDLPKDNICKDKLAEFGFFKFLVDENNKEININTNGDYFSFQKRSRKVTLQDLKYFDDLSNETYKFITGEIGEIDELNIILKEISGNAVEWSNSYNEQWLLGVLKEKNKVTFTVTDLGKGIIETLFISDKLKLIDYFLFKDNLDILKRAFDRKYGSLSQEINRNQGLPSIKNAFINNKIKNLIICTNDVILHFDNNQKSMKFNNIFFKGTFYQWEIDNSCLNN